MLITFNKFLAFIILCSFLSANVFATSSWSIKKFRKRGKKATKEIITLDSAALAENEELKPILFAFDLDETLTENAYKGKGRESGTTKIKEEVAHNFYSILSEGHKLAVVTANVRADVESFLMDKLGFDPRNKNDYTLFRKLVTVKQPDLPEHLHYMQPLKPSKGKMIKEVVDELQEKNITIKAVVFSDDKTGFLEQGLSAKINLPFIALRVGKRPHYHTDFGSLFDSFKSSYEDAGESSLFLNLVNLMSKDKRAAQILFKYAKRSILETKSIKKLLQKFPDKSIQEKITNIELKDKLISAGFSVSEEELQSDEGEYEEVTRYKKSRNFSGKKPVLPPYFNKQEL